MARGMQRHQRDQDHIAKVQGAPKRTVGLLWWWLPFGFRCTKPTWSSPSPALPPPKTGQLFGGAFWDKVYTRHPGIMLKTSRRYCFCCSSFCSAGRRAIRAAGIYIGAGVRGGPWWDAWRAARRSWRARGAGERGGVAQVTRAQVKWLGWQLVGGLCARGSHRTCTGAACPGCL